MVFKFLTVYHNCVCYDKYGPTGGGVLLSSVLEPSDQQKHFKLCLYRFSGYMNFVILCA